MEASSLLAARLQSLVLEGLRSRTRRRTVLKKSQSRLGTINATQRDGGEVELGHIISAKGISVNPEKVASIVNWEPPQNVKQLHSFLGLASYCRRSLRISP